MTSFPRVLSKLNQTVFCSNNFLFNKTININSAHVCTHAPLHTSKVESSRAITPVFAFPCTTTTAKRISRENAATELAIFIFTYNKKGELRKGMMLMKEIKRKASTYTVGAVCAVKKKDCQHKKEEKEIV